MYLNRWKGVLAQIGSDLHLNTELTLFLQIKLIFIIDFHWSILNFTNLSWFCLLKLVSKDKIVLVCISSIYSHKELWFFMISSDYYCSNRIFFLKNSLFLNTHFYRVLIVFNWRESGLTRKVLFSVDYKFICSVFHILKEQILKWICLI